MRERILQKNIDTVYESFVSYFDHGKQSVLREQKSLIIPPILSSIGLCSKSHYSENELDDIAQALKRNVYAVGRRLVDSIENEDQLESPTTLEANARNVSKHLLFSTVMGEDGDDVLKSHLCTPYNIEAAFTQHNPIALDALRKAFQNFLYTLAKPAIDLGRVDDPADEKQLTAFINNFLSFYSLLEPVTNEKIMLPKKIGSGMWEAVEYQFERIDISPKSGLIADLLIEERDRIYAYGLIAINHPLAEPYLLWSGTAFDVGQGVYLSRASVITPGYSMGESHDMSLVSEWINKQKHKVITCGQSQGGVLAMLTAARYPDKIASAHCLSPSALSKHTLARMLPKWCAIPEARRPSISVYTQYQDPIFNLEKGFLPGKNTRIFLLIPESNKLSVNASLTSLLPKIPSFIVNKITPFIAHSFQAHAHFYSAHRYLVMIELNLERENARVCREFSSNLKLFASNLFFPANKANLLMHLLEKKYKFNSIHKAGGYSILLFLLGALVNEALKNPRLTKGILLGLIFYLVVFPQIEGEINYRMALSRVNGNT